MKLDLRGPAALVICALALPALAHHSFAMFDAGKSQTIEGTVRQFQWTNPHSWLYVTVPDAAGKSDDWAIEMGSPSGMARQGWVPKTLTPGMNVKVVIHPLVDGNNGGQYLAITLPDGKKMGNPEGRVLGGGARGADNP